VLKLQNPAGDYVRPTATDVTTALRLARVKENPQSPEFLQENLDNVYRDKNPNSYPLSSYSYWIVPRAHTKLPTNFTTAKGKTLSIVTKFALCAGQHKINGLGYAPLPPNLVAAGLLEVREIPGHVPVPAHCPR
jgi:ABC-type phosphate transport system substrate-binding protein